MASDESWEGPAMISWEDAREWDKYLQEFDRMMMPVFRDHNITKPAAVQMFMNNRLYNAIQELMDLIEDKLDG